MDDDAQYRSDLGYTHGYHRELAPGLIDFAILLSGYCPPERTGMNYLDLGYGQGLTVNIHAAACPGAYYGTDFIQEHAANAQDLARASGADAHFEVDGFTDYAKRPDLPKFDYVVMHGIWSWVPEADRQAIVTILRERMNTAGVVYLGYNCQPGWAAEMPLRELLARHGRRVGGDGGRSPESVDAAIDFAGALVEVGARYFTDNPTATKRLEGVARHDRRYLAHDYFNLVWTPCYFADLAERLEAASLRYAGPARVQQRIDSLLFTSEQSALLGSVEDPILRETARDFVSNRSFRSDLFTRREVRLSGEAQTERLLAVRLTLTVRADEIALDIFPMVGPVSLDRAIYEPVIQAMEADGGAPKSIADLLARPQIAALPPGALLEAIAVLVGLKHAHPVQADDDIAAARPRCEALNQVLRDRARKSADVRFLASPVIGAGVGVSRFEQLFLGARRQGLTRPEQWAREAQAALSANGEFITKSGKVLQLSADAIAELTPMAAHFASNRLGLLERLEVA